MPSGGNRIPHGGEGVCSGGQGDSRNPRGSGSNHLEGRTAVGSGGLGGDGGGSRGDGVVGGSDGGDGGAVKEARVLTGGLTVVETLQTEVVEPRRDTAEVSQGIEPGDFVELANSRDVAKTLRAKPGVKVALHEARLEEELREADEASEEEEVEGCVCEGTAADEVRTALSCRVSYVPQTHLVIPLGLDAYRPARELTP
ncbi:hypothetical protein RHMOL_Rhmol02G0136300 [Rhododendron molle]|uniref:Uncharacterized protein n=1 Tax=Rhododendron molle TaxID=49168 RepID=A0ACC0PR69_RHOML|nr:hypothetical protein RHMOL_Rhmol02G0136300 [Rhododendron molle]